MATEKQIEANKANARLSTGPRTEAGKMTARWNSYKHGLAGSGVLMPPDEAFEIEQRMATWRVKFGGRCDEKLLKQLAVESIKLEHAQELTRAYRGHLVDRSQQAWGELRREMVEKIGTELHKNPGRMGLQLGSTAFGCEWILGRWCGLLAAIVENGEWTDVQRSLTLDLMGVPLEFREGKTLIDCPDEGVSLLDFRKDLVKQQIERYTVISQELVVYEQDERDRYGLGLIWETDAVLDRLRRYEVAASKGFRWAYQRLDRELRERNRPTSRPVTNQEVGRPALPREQSREELPLNDAEREAVELEFQRLLADKSPRQELERILAQTNPAGMDAASAPSRATTPALSGSTHPLASNPSGSPVRRRIEADSFSVPISMIPDPPRTPAPVRNEPNFLFDHEPKRTDPGAGRETHRR